MAVSSLRAAFPRMDVEEKQARALQMLAAGLMPGLLQALNPAQLFAAPVTEKE